MPKNSRRSQAQANRNYCFGCGKDNPDSMRLKFAYNERRRSFVSEFRLGRRFTGPPGYCHGGIIATIMDEAMAKLNKLHDRPAATSQIVVNYLRPVPLHKTLRVEAREISVRGRRRKRTAEILDGQGRVLTHARGVFIALNSHHVFAKR